MAAGLGRIKNSATATIPEIHVITANKWADFITR
jgi:hypothetical protein